MQSKIEFLKSLTTGDVIWKASTVVVVVSIIRNGYEGMLQRMAHTCSELADTYRNED